MLPETLWCPQIEFGMFTLVLFKCSMSVMYEWMVPPAVIMSSFHLKIQFCRQQPFFICRIGGFILQSLSHVNGFTLYCWLNPVIVSHLYIMTFFWCSSLKWTLQQCSNPPSHFNHQVFHFEKATIFLYFAFLISLFYLWFFSSLSSFFLFLKLNTWYFHLHLKIAYFLKH